MFNYSTIDDNDLQRLAANGDSFAEEALVERYMRLVRICARPLFLAGGDSEDLIQEGMFGLLSAIRQYDPDQKASFKTFAEHCIKNRLLTAVKSASSTKHIPLNARVSLDALLSDESQTTSLAYAVSFQKSPEEQVLARENKMELQQSFKRCLSPMERNVLRLYLDGLSYQEIAEQTGKPIKAVDNAIQRIRRKLAQNLDSGVISKS